MSLPDPSPTDPVLPDRAPAETALDDARFEHVSLSVADLERQAAFYTALGFREEARLEFPSLATRSAVLRLASGVGVELVERQGSQAHPAGGIADSADHQTYVHWAIQVGDLGAAYRAALDAGATSVAQPGPTQRPGRRFAFVADPEGNLIELLGI